MPYAKQVAKPLPRWRPRGSDKGLPLAKRLPLLRLAVANAPTRLDLRRNLALALFKSDRLTEVVDLLRPTVTEPSADAEILCCFGRAALGLGDCQLAADTLRTATSSGSTEAFVYLAEALLKLGRPDEAIDAGLRGIEHPSSNFRSLSVIAKVLVDRGEIERLWNICVDLRTKGKWGGFLPAVMAYAAAALGYDDEVAALIDPARWFEATRLSVSEDFNRNLARELLAQQSMRAFHSTRAARGTGTWMDRLDHVGGPLSQELLRSIKLTVADYVATRQRFANHPMIAHQPSYIDLVSWAVELRDDGHQTRHIHPSGWISGSYYVAVPEIDAGDAEAPGTIEFGLMPFGHDQMRADLPRWSVSPQPGMLLLFPSYFAHSTRPTGVGDARICIAFDVTPCAS
jgi:uncharacterized protein (TIGR02466 family)